MSNQNSQYNSNGGVSQRENAKFIQKNKSSVLFPTEKTSMYKRNNQNNFEKVIRFTDDRKFNYQPTGQVVKNLPGIDGYQIPSRQYGFEDFDSDDEAAARPTILPKKRTVGEWTDYFYQIDFYGITPSMIIGGQRQFRSCWGSFFSLVFILGLAYYSLNKAMFLMNNRASNFIDKPVYMGYQSFQGQQIMNLSGGNVSLEIQFSYDKIKAKLNNFNYDSYLQDLLGFSQYLQLEVHTVETDSSTLIQTDTVTYLELSNNTIVYKNIGKVPTPTIQIDPSLLQLRGDPNIQHSDLEWWPDFDNSSALIAPTINAITSYIVLKPNVKLLNQTAYNLYLQQPAAFYNSIFRLDEQSIMQYNQLLLRFGRNYTTTNFTYYQAMIFNQFVTNCSNYVASLVLKDQVIAQNVFNQGMYITRQQTLFSKRIQVVSNQTKIQKVRFSINQVDNQNSFIFPSISWIYADPTDYMNSTNNTFLVQDKYFEADDWPQEIVSWRNISLDNKTLTNLTFDGELLRIQFYLNHIGHMYQKQTFKNWILDQIADLGGFGTVIYIVCWFFTAYMQLRLYQAKLMKDRYRLKFNKPLKGIKETKKKFKKTEEKQQIQELIKEKSYSSYSDSDENMNQQKIEQLKIQQEEDDNQAMDQIEIINLEGGGQEKEKFDQFENYDFSMESSEERQSQQIIQQRQALNNSNSQNQRINYEGGTEGQQNNEQQEEMKSDRSAGAFIKQVNDQNSKINDSPQTKEGSFIQRILSGTFFSKNQDLKQKVEDAQGPNEKQTQQFVLNQNIQQQKLDTLTSNKQSENVIKFKETENASAKSSKRKLRLEKINDEQNGAVQQTVVQEDIENEQMNQTKAINLSQIQAVPPAVLTIQSPDQNSKKIQIQQEQHSRDEQQNIEVKNIQEEQKSKEMKKSVEIQVVTEKAPSQKQTDDQSQLQPENKLFYKLYDFIKISNFQIIRLVFTPRCFYTYYQMALDRLLDKSYSKQNRELEISQILRRIKYSENLCRSFETHEIFSGLQKKYKNSYSNIINVSINTEESIIQENQKPIPPAETPYQRKKVKTYKQTPDGNIVGVMQFAPYELDKDALQIIAKTVWKKIRKDAKINQMIEKDLQLEDKIAQLQFQKGIEIDQKQVDRDFQSEYLYQDIPKSTPYTAIKKQINFQNLEIINSNKQSNNLTKQNKEQNHKNDSQKQNEQVIKQRTQRPQDLRKSKIQEVESESDRNIQSEKEKKLSRNQSVNQSIKSTKEIFDADISERSKKQKRTQSSRKSEQFSQSSLFSKMPSVIDDDVIKQKIQSALRKQLKLRFQKNK